nr:MAG TPA: hypothetical protein [Caudoviricetes sp.]
MSALRRSWKSSNSVEFARIKKPPHAGGLVYFLG